MGPKNHVFHVSDGVHVPPWEGVIFRGEMINNKRWRILTCAQKLTNSQLNQPHATKQKRLMKKLKIKTEMLRRNSPVIKPWSQS